MRRLALLLLLLPACAPRYRTETLGAGTAGGAGVAVSEPGAHTVTWAVSTPRALRLHWVVTCAGATMDGATGESFADYEARRLAELRAEKQQEKDAVASLVGAVGAGANVRTPDSEAHAEVHADGAAVADAVVDDDVVLPAGDLGAAVYRGEVSLDVTAPGTCTMAVAPEDAAEDAAGVVAEFQVTRTIDVGAERAQEVARRRDGAIAVRGALTASLVAQGADPDHQRKVAAEVQASLQVRLDLEAQARAEQDAQLAAEQGVRVVGAIQIRDRLRAQLIALGADPDYQARRAAELDAELRVRAGVEVRAQAELDAQLRAEAAAEQDAAWRARQDEQARIDAAIGVRAQLGAFLISIGADPDYQVKLDARVQADAAAAADAELRARDAAWARFDAAFDVRARLTANLIALGADPDFQRKRAAAIVEERRQRDAAEDARLWAEADAHDRARAERDRRIDGALAVRVELLAYLEGLGAFAIPAMPELRYEDQGVSPGDGSVWIAGEWVWRGREWVWLSGGWSIPTGVATTTTVDHDPDATVDAGVSIDLDLPVKVPVIVIEHRDDPPPSRPKTREHRK